MTTSNLKFFGILFFNPFVRSANLVSWRFGRPYGCSFDSIRPYIETLRPGMVIVTRTNFLFGNLFIHGYWTHAGLVMPGNKLIEAVGGGVRETTLEQFFLQADDFAVYDPVVADHEIARHACEFAKQAIGLKYNFSFRRKLRKYYCSELIYLSFETGLRKCRGTMDYTEFAKPYWERRFIITPDWLVASPLQWKKISIPQPVSV